MYNFDTNEVVIDGQYYNIEVLRQRAYRYLPNLLSKYFIKCISVDGRRVFTYDFDGLFFRNGATNPELPRWFLQFGKYCFSDEVMPVMGLSSDTMSSEDGCAMIYKAILKSFTLNLDEKVKNGKHLGHVPIEVVSGRDISKTTALTILCGLAKMHDFSAKEAMELVGGNVEDFNDHWKWFKEEIRAYTNPDPELSDEKRSKARRFYNKVVLVLNYLKHSVQHPLSELAHLH